METASRKPIAGPAFILGGFSKARSRPSCRSIRRLPGGWSVTSQQQLASLGDGEFSRGNVFNALQFRGDPRSLIEDAIGGSGNDLLAGNAADNAIRGASGQDYILGRDGHASIGPV